MENISSFTYRPDLTRTWVEHTKGTNFLMGIQSHLLASHFQSIVNEVHPLSKSGDAHLETFLATYNTLEMFIESPPIGLSLVVFPKFGKILEYKLKEDQEFFTNIHQNPDPLIIKDIRIGLYLKPTGKDSVWFPGRYSTAPNLIEGAVLLKRNPTKRNPYKGFNHYLNYDPNRPRTYKNYK